MEYIMFSDTCTYEIGDKIQVIVNRGVCVTTILDIVCMHFVRTGLVEFRYLLDCGNEYVTLEGESSLERLVH